MSIITDKTSSSKDTLDILNEKNNVTDTSEEFDPYSNIIDKKVEKDSDIEGGELDYEEEAVQSSDDKKDQSKDIEEGEDEGEISGEEDDLEEGELKEITSCETSQSTQRQICRFFTRGQCYYGSVCRFLHLTNGKGQYNMFARYSEGYNPVQQSIITDKSSQRMGMDFISSISNIPPPIEQSYVESAWERGLREAKELVKKANKRKEEEPDFDKKKNYLSIHFNEKNTSFEKENEYLKSPFSHKRNPDASYKNSCDFDDSCLDHRGERTSYENFEIHYNSRNMPDDILGKKNVDRRTRARSGGRIPIEHDRDRYVSKDQNRNKSNIKVDRASLHTQAFEYVDPWRRSKTPKAKGGRSRSGSYSSVSSSYSERTSRSGSASYSRSSSPSSGASSRSPSLHKPKASGISTEFPKGSKHLPQIRKKPNFERSPSFSSRSRSRSLSSAPSFSRSRSISHSISMDSVSSESSCVSHSSVDSFGNEKKGPDATQKSDEKLPLEMLDVYREQGASDPSIIHNTLEEPINSSPSVFPSFRHLIPGNDRVKGPQKQPIKLTLLSKPTSSKSCFLKKDTDRPNVFDLKNDSSNTEPAVCKRPLSPTLSALHMKPDSLLPKKSASSRRDELLKQLKAVEDAIARKRAKFC